MDTWSERRRLDPVGRVPGRGRLLGRDRQPLGAHFDGTTWSTAQKIAPTGPDQRNDMTVRCATVTTCAALDEIGNVYRYADESWAHQHDVGPARLIDCATASSCTVVLRDQTLGRVARWDGSRWRVHRALPIGYSFEPMGLSCPMKRSCVMVDEAGTAWRRH